MEDVVANPRPAPESPGPYEIQELLAEAVQRVGAAEMSKGRLDLSTPLMQRALDIRRANFERFDETEEYLKADEAGRKSLMAEAGLTLDRSLMATAYSMVKQGDAATGLVEFGKVIESRRAAVAKFPDIPKLRQEYGRFCGLFGDCLMWEGRLGEALAQFEESVSIAGDFWNADQKNAELRKQLALALNRRASLREQTGDSDGERSDATAAAGHRQAIVDSSKAEKDEADLALSAARLGQTGTVRPILDKFASATRPDSEIQLKCARACSQLARHASGDDQEKLRSETMTILRRAIAEGYSDPYKVRVEADFYWLRETPEFAELVASIGK
jgi:tetratricopeptide (TPR) repeat protein